MSIFAMNGELADERTYNIEARCFYLLYVDPDRNGDGEFVDLYIDRRDIRKAKQAYDKYYSLSEEERKKLNKEIGLAMNGKLDAFDAWSDLWEDK